MRHGTFKITRVDGITLLSAFIYDQLHGNCTITNEKGKSWTIVLQNGEIVKPQTKVDHKQRRSVDRSKQPKVNEKNRDCHIF